MKPWRMVNTGLHSQNGAMGVLHCRSQFRRICPAAAIHNPSMLVSGQSRVVWKAEAEQKPELNGGWYERPPGASSGQQTCCSCLSDCRIRGAPDSLPDIRQGTLLPCLVGYTDSEVAGAG